MKPIPNFQFWGFLCIKFFCLKTESAVFSDGDLNAVCFPLPNINGCWIGHADQLYLVSTNLPQLQACDVKESACSAIMIYAVAPFYTIKGVVRKLSSHLCLRDDHYIAVDRRVGQVDVQGCPNLFRVRQKVESDQILRTTVIIFLQSWTFTLRKLFQSPLKFFIIF